MKVYDTVVKRARKLGRLPLQAREVYEEILVKLRRTIRETKMQRKERSVDETLLFESPTQIKTCQLNSEWFVPACST